MRSAGPTEASWDQRFVSSVGDMRANREDEENSRFFQDRYKAVRLLDEASLLACAADVDLNPIHAALAETLETSDHTSLQRRIESLRDKIPDAAETDKQPKTPPTPSFRVLKLTNFGQVITLVASAARCTGLAAPQFAATHRLRGSAGLRPTKATITSTTKLRCRNNSQDALSPGICPHRSQKRRPARR